VVGHPGYAPGISPSQAARIGYLPRARGNWLNWPWRSRRDLHSLMTRLTTVRLDDFGFGTLALVKWWESVVMLHSSTSGMFCDGRFTVG
jgi:hypothetical protein